MKAANRIHALTLADESLTTNQNFATIFKTDAYLKLLLDSLVRMPSSVSPELRIAIADQYKTNLLCMGPQIDLDLVRDTWRQHKRDCLEMLRDLPGDHKFLQAVPGKTNSQGCPTYLARRGEEPSGWWLKCHDAIFAVLQLHAFEWRCLHPTFKFGAFRRSSPAAEEILSQMSPETTQDAMN